MKRRMSEGKLSKQERMWKGERDRKVKWDEERKQTEDELLQLVYQEHTN